ncbi:MULTISPECIES: SDR family oxidoreductase [Mumia]|uniref:SDR family oxidoreductase n=1 Tax=Mumia TaxID=1546255 RepID=UPI0014228DA9|nr:NAD(P)H-binding protein [Mumia sp. ZJ430]
MRVAVAGGTGMLGAQVCEALASRGHEARALSRSSADFPVDLSTGEGLREALAGCDAVVDASNGQGKAAQAVLVDGSRRLLDAEAAAGVGHHIAISIVGCDLVPSFGYYRAKVAQEGVVRSGSVPWTVVRATQFHGFLDMVFGAAAKVGLRPSSSMPLQPVDVDDLADVVAGVAEGTGEGRTLEVVGPEVVSLRDLGRAWRRASGRGRVPLRIPFWGKTGRALHDGALTSVDPYARGKVGFESWLERRYA